MSRQRLPQVILIVVLIFQTLTHLFWLPIAAHSGQVAIPWMMNQGMTLFGDVLEQHAPGTSLVAAFLQQILPLEPIDIARFLNLLLVLALTIAIYVLAKRLANDDERAGIFAILVWAWWEPVYGNILFYFDSVLGFIVLVAIIVWTGRERPGIWQIIFTGLLMGLATIFKQHGWASVALFGLWMLVFHRVWRDIGLYILAALVMPVLLLIFFASQGNLESYLYWNWEYNLSGLMDGVPLSGEFFRKLLITNILAVPFWLIGIRDRNRSWFLLGLMWVAGLATLYPRFGEIHAMTHLPFVVVMSGLVLTYLVKHFIRVRSWRQIDIAEMTLGGVFIALMIGWLWTGAVVYIPHPIGIGYPLAYREFTSLAEQINELRQDGDTLFVLPETDSTPQLHVLTNMPPPGTWVKGWHWYFEAPGVVDNLLNEWQTQPPTYVVIFTQGIQSGEPGIIPLVEFVTSNYELIGEGRAYGHNGGQIYRWRE